MRKFPSLLCSGLFTIAILSCVSAQGPTISSAQEAKVDADADGNYVLSLSSPADKKAGPEMALVVALPKFDSTHDPVWTQTTFEAVDNAQPSLRFKGTFLPQKDGRYLLNYYVECSGDFATSGVLLRAGEPVQMIKCGGLYFNLRLERYNTPGLR